MSALITMSRRIEFDSGHRLAGHESKCSNAHGHRYVAEIMCTATHLDSVGRIIDFAEVKRLVGGWVDASWDHAFILEQGDPLHAGLRAINSRVYLFPSGQPPTAENMAAHLLEVARSLLKDTPIHVVAVKLYETPNCWAEAR